jgi:carbonic anhydrase
MGKKALDRLREGNRRFFNGELSGHIHLTHAERVDMAKEQEPFAIILGCSDSRVPAEIVFDQGLGDLFVIRVAGNIVAPSQIGSVEFAVSQFGIRLVVVLGHSNCGAVLATLQEVRHKSENPSKNLLSIVDRVRPSVEALLKNEPDHDPETLVDRAVKANVMESVRHLRTGSPILRELVANEGLTVVGAEYSLETGKVEFYCEPED